MIPQNKKKKGGLEDIFKETINLPERKRKKKRNLEKPSQSEDMNDKNV